MHNVTSPAASRAVNVIETAGDRLDVFLTTAEPLAWLFGVALLVVLVAVCVRWFRRLSA